MIISQTTRCSFWHNSASLKPCPSSAESLTIVSFKEQSGGEEATKNNVTKKPSTTRDVNKPTRSGVRVGWSFIFEMCAD